MRVTSCGIVSVRVLADVEEQRHDLGMPMLRCQCESSMPLLGIRDGKVPLRSFDAASRGGCDQVYSRATTNQRVNCFEFTVTEGREHRAIRISAVVAQQIDQRDLHTTFAWHAARTYKPERRGDRALIHSSVRVENRSGHLDNVRRQAVVADRVLCDKLQERRVAEIVAALERDPLTRDTWMAD